MTNTLQTMTAEILFADPNQVNSATAVLIEHDFEVEILDLVDLYSSTVFVVARGHSNVSEDDFFGWMQSIVAPFGGYVEEAGPGTGMTSGERAIAEGGE